MAQDMLNAADEAETYLDAKVSLNKLIEIVKQDVHLLMGTTDELLSLGIKTLLMRY